jgi:hypothetical protein
MQKEEIITKKIKQLIKEPGYIHALFHITLDYVLQVRDGEWLTTKELAFVWGFFIQEEIDFSEIDKKTLLKYEAETYKLMHERHMAIFKPLSIKKKKDGSIEVESDNASNIKEGITYSADNVYGAQYVDLLPQQYKYDKGWLLTNKNFNIEKQLKIEKSIVEIINRNAQKLNNGTLSIFPLIIKKSDFDETLNIESFLDNFSTKTGSGINEKFQKTGDFNLINARPIIQLDEESYLVIAPFLLTQAIYNSPFYWMGGDESYKGQLFENRGKVGEEMVHEMLSKVFGEKNTFKSVDIYKSKADRISEIDVLCILGNKALCVQVKSKKLTSLSKNGNYEKIKEDFTLAVQEGYEQGLLCRKEILKKQSRFINEQGEAIIIPKEINEVYIMAITMDGYPALMHQTGMLLDKKDPDPDPIVMSVFDLDTVTLYLNNPYDFLYYVRQRINLIDYIKASGEVGLLEFHLFHKLQKPISSNYIFLGNDAGLKIDKNYYEFRVANNIFSRNKLIKEKWKNTEFKEKIAQMEKVNLQNKTDLIFTLLDQLESDDPYHGKFDSNFQQDFPKKRKKIGRNKKCPCGSFIKYKKCCGKNN